MRKFQDTFETCKQPFITAFSICVSEIKKTWKKKNGNLLWNQLKKRIFLKKCFLNHVPWVPAFVEKACLIIWSRIDKVLVIKHQVKMIMAWNFEKSIIITYWGAVSRIKLDEFYSQLHLLPDLTSFQNNSFNKVWIKT